MSDQWVVVSNKDTEVIQTTTEQVVVVPPSSAFNTTVTTCSQGPPGPTGPKGPPGDAPTLFCSYAISGHRVLSLRPDGKAIYADYRDESALSVQGVSMQAGAQDEEVLIKKYGPMAWPSGNLQPNMPLFLKDNGLISHTPPTSGWLRQVAVALDPDTISVDIGPIWYIGD